MKIKNIALALGGLMVAAAALGAAAQAAEPVKIGMITTLSGGGSSLGIDVRDGFQLALKEGGGSLGGVPVELLVEDDGRKPDTATQTAQKFMKREQVDIMTGIIWSNLAMAVVPKVDRGGRDLHQPQRRPLGPGRRQELPRELLQRRLAERQPARSRGPVRQGPGLQEGLHPGAQLSGRPRTP